MEQRKKVLKNFNGDELATDVFIKKYAIKDEKNGELKEFSMDDMRNRLSIAISKVENFESQNEWIGKFRKTLDYFIPGGRILYALGNSNDSTATLKNCYVIQIDEDSIDGIFETAKKQAKLFSRGGGVGFDISKLRPKGTMVNNSAKTTSGAVSFMDLYSMVTGIIGQYGRRGALMISMDISHPDIIDFIKVKGGADKSKVQYANISVKISDEFMEALKNNTEWEMTYKLKDGTTFSKKEKAQLIWDLFVESNWNGAEPGLFFWNNMCDGEPSSIFDETRVIGTNPCFTEDTVIAVADGRNGVTIKELAEKNETFPVYSAKKNGSKNCWKSEIKNATAFKTGTKNIITVELSDGSSFRCTPDHLLALPDGKSYIEAQHSLNCELAKFYTFSDKNTNKSYRTINSKNCGYNRQYRMIYEFYNGLYNGKTHNIDHIDSNSTNDKLSNLELITIEEHHRRTKRFSMDNPIMKIKGTEYLSLYCSRSNINANGVKYNWSKEKIDEKLKEWDSMNGERLLELYTEKHSNNVYMDDPIYVTKIIDNGEIQDVYDLSVENNHNFYIITCTNDNQFLNCSGILVHNCSEKPLSNGGSCCLGSLDLNKFVKNSFTDKAEFDFELFNEMVQNSMRFLDNINLINLDREPLDINKEASLLGNDVGLGATGLADCFIRMNIKYGSKEADDLTNEIGKVLYVSSIKASVDLAKERGACGILQKYKNNDKYNEWFEHKYFNNFKEILPSYIDDLKKYGTRNIGFTTMAPSGSISIILQTSSGIEPIYQLSYERTVHQAGKDGKKEKYTVYHPLVLEYNKLFGENAHLKNPNFVTSSQINWKDRINLQSTIQKWISAAISSTVNLPNDTTKEIISDIYKYAYEKGLKGITIYRDGCREGVLNATEKDKREWQILDDYKFPEESPAWQKIIRSEGRKWYVHYTIDEETKLPNSIFVHANKKAAIEKTMLTDEVCEKLIKLARKYIKNGHLDKLLQNVENNDTNVVKMARLIGMLLRHRIPIIEIIKTIDEINPPVYSFIFQIKKLLGAYLPKNTLTGEKCLSCGCMLIFSGGCSLCPECGESRC